MRLEFLKMHGLGNDFLVFDAPAHSEAQQVDSSTVRVLAHRRTGIGFDQALMLEAPREPSHRAFYRIFNADGSEVEQCGNGARCVAALMFARRPDLGREFSLESVGGIVQARVSDDGLVSVNMGIPNFDPRSLPMSAPGERASYTLDLDGTLLEFGAVSMGNPHVVVRVTDVENAPVNRVGQSIERHHWFPKRTNVGFMQILDRGRIRLRVYERGVGETLACGTGACGAVAVGRHGGFLDAEVQVELPGGTAFVSWPGAGRPAWLTGPATPVFSGAIDV